MLIDLRSVDQFKAFALPGAINIQPDSLFSVTNLELLNQSGKDKVLYANADLTAEKVWLLYTRYSVNRLYILKGGLNEWYNTIIKEPEIIETASSTDLDLLSFRKAALQYFTGAGQKAEKPAANQTPEKIQIVRKAPKATSGGGC
jgi:rhodanese-related sulfurtransferase